MSDANMFRGATHILTVYQGRALGWWWKCVCEDEGGPYDTWEESDNAAIDHERGVQS